MPKQAPTAGLRLTREQETAVAALYKQYLMETGFTESAAAVLDTLIALAGSPEAAAPVVARVRGLAANLPAHQARGGGAWMRLPR